MQNGIIKRLTHWVTNFVVLVLLAGLAGCGPSEETQPSVGELEPNLGSEAVVITFSNDENAYRIGGLLLTDFRFRFCWFGDQRWRTSTETCGYQYGNCQERLNNFIVRPGSHDLIRFLLVLFL